MEYKNKRLKIKYIVSVLFLSILLGTFSFLVIQNRKIDKTTTIPIITDTQNIKQPKAPLKTPEQPKDSPNNKINPTIASSKAYLSTTDSSTSLVAPEGIFVSNHKPSLNKNPSLRFEQSTCITTPGAECFIKLTNTNGLVRILPTKKVDDTGTASWRWSISSANLTIGSWQVTATSTLKDKSRTTADMIMLDIQP